MPTSDDAAAGHDGRWLVEIDTWDWNLFVGMGPTAMPDEAGFQGRLMYTNSISIEGRVVAPRVHRGKAISVWLSPFGEERRFGGDDVVGHVTLHAPPLHGRDAVATLHLPRDALPGALTCLASIWKFAHFWTLGSSGEAPISDFCFSRDIHENVQAWINEQ